MNYRTGMAAAVAAMLLAGTMASPTQACWWWGSSWGAYRPNYYSAGYAPGVSTSYYGGSSYGYSYNSYAPLYGSPSYGTSFYRGYSSFYAPAYYGGGCSSCDPCGCSPCAGGGCATGNCGVSASSQKPADAEPTPANAEEAPMPTYDPMETEEKPPMDDPGFRPTQPDGTDEFPSVEGTDAFKFPTPGAEESGDLPTDDKSAPVNPLKDETDGGDAPAADEEAAPTEAPLPTLNGPVQPIDRINSASVAPLGLDQKLTWRSRPVPVRSAATVETHRPLVVRRTVHVPAADRQATRTPQVVSK